MSRQPEAARGPYGLYFFFQAIERKGIHTLRGKMLLAKRADGRRINDKTANAKKGKNITHRS
jgi:hypothetical protein